jgi:hypothetical protein
MPMKPVTQIRLSLKNRMRRKNLNKMLNYGSGYGKTG